jgi:membrane-associated phospholipid phosphatase
MYKILDYLINIDLNLWYNINIEWQNAFFDMIMPWLRNPLTWIPVYILLLIWSLKNLKKQTIWWVFSFLLAFGLSDYFSASIIKPIAERLRPCNNEYLKEVVHLIVQCGPGYSFPSAHAANHTAIAAFIIWTIRPHAAIKYLLILWPLLVGYAQVYVGVHFPMDVLMGGVLGVVMGWLGAQVYKQLGKKYPLTKTKQPV